MMRYLITLFILLIASQAWAFHTPIGSTGAFLTQAELDIVKTRCNSFSCSGGPYCAASDESTNSPADCTRIKSQADALVSSPTGQIWSGPTDQANCWPVNSSPAPSDPPFSREYGMNLTSAAFVYKITDDTSYRDAVITALTTQAGTAGTDFTDSPPWCHSTQTDGFVHDLGNFIMRHAVAYDLVKDEMSGAQQSTMDAWLIAFAQWADEITANTIEKRFPNRDSDDYATCGAGYGVGGSCDSNGGSETILYLKDGGSDGPTEGAFHEGWNNRGNAMAMTAGVIGKTIGGNTSRDAGITLIDSAKRYAKEFLAYATFPDSGEYHPEDMERWRNGPSGNGWHYSMDVINTIMFYADVLARLGDFELLDYTTSAGIFGSSGGTKSIQNVYITMLKYVDATLVNYGTDNPANQNSTYQIRPLDGESGAHRVWDIGASMGNIRWRDSTLTDQYTRTSTAGEGAQTYPSTPDHGLSRGWAGNWRAPLPAMLLLRGQMEGKVWVDPDRGIGSIW